MFRTRKIKQTVRERNISEFIMNIAETKKKKQENVC